MVYFWFKKCVFILVSLCLQLYWLRAVQFNARSACDASMFTSCIYIFLRLASKWLNCTRSPEEIVQKLHKYDWKHKINSLKIDSDNFTKLPVTFLVENNNENRVKLAKFFNILLNFSLWLCVVQVTDYYYTRCLSSPNICYKFLTCLRELTHSWRKISAMLLVSAIHAIQRKQCVYIVQSSCPNLTGLAWTRDWRNLTQVSAMLLVSATYVILRKITSAIRDQSENR